MCIADSFPSALIRWLQIIVLLMYTFFYLNFYYFDSLVADRSIFGKGIFCCCYYSGLLVAITFCTFCMIYLNTNLIIFLSSYHSPKRCLLPFAAFPNILRVPSSKKQTPSFLPCCFILYLIAYLFFTFIYLCWKTLSWDYNWRLCSHSQ